jgi:hypothetical protein
VFRCQLSMLQNTQHLPKPESLCKILESTATGTGKWRWCLHKHGDRKSRYAQLRAYKARGWKYRTRAWRRNLPNLIRNGHEPAHYVRSCRSWSSLWGVKSPCERVMRCKLTRSAHYAGCSWSCILHRGKLHSATELSGRLTLQNGQHRGNSFG